MLQGLRQIQIWREDLLKKYGLIDGNGNRIYMSYAKYLQQKADIPLYLATVGGASSGNPQVELIDRDINLTQKNDLSSKIGKKFVYRSRNF